MSTIINLNVDPDSELVTLNATEDNTLVTINVIIGDGSGGSGGGGSTDLTWIASPGGVTIASSTGNDAIGTLVDGTNWGLVSPAMKSTWDAKQNNLGYTPANKAGDTFTGVINATNLSGTNTGDETNTTIKTKLGQSSSSTDGWLSSADWNTFNNKISDAPNDVNAYVRSGLAWVIGYTKSAIDTLLNSYALKDSPTFTTKTTHNYATASKIAVFNASKELVSGTISESDITTQQITITTGASSITTATTDAGGLSQNNRNVIIDNSTNAINFTLNGSVTASYLKHGTGVITLLRGSGREMYVNGADVSSALFNGLVGSTMSIIQVGSRDYVNINNI